MADRRNFLASLAAAVGALPFSAKLAAELVLEVGLGPGCEDAGAPELVRHEQEDEEPERHQHAADRRDRASHDDRC